MPSDRVQAALDEFRAALVEEGMDPHTVEAQTRMILPSEIILGGNYADLQRLGASSLATNTPNEVAGVVKPPQPISDATFHEETGEAHATIEGMGVGGAGTAPAESATAPSDLEGLTKDELRDRIPDGVSVPASATKADLIEAIERG